MKSQRSFSRPIVFACLAAFFLCWVLERPLPVRSETAAGTPTAFSPEGPLADCKGQIGGHAEDLGCGCGDPPPPAPGPYGCGNAPPATGVKLFYALVAGDALTLRYFKSFETCAHIWRLEGNTWVLRMYDNFICETGREAVAGANMPFALQTVLKPGDLIKLCHGNASGICSAEVTVEAAPAPSGF